MGNASIFEPVKFFTEEEQVIANTKIVDHVVQILFSFFGDQEDELDNEEIFNDFVDSLTSIASLILAVAGMNIIGENSEGNLVSKFVPLASMEEFAKKHNIS
jgi:hypothetical protein